MLRGIVFLALVGGAGMSAWTSWQDSSRPPLDWAVGEVHAMLSQENPPEAAAQPAEAEPVAPALEDAQDDDRFFVSKETLAAITCGPWDISAVGIETILTEMIRRGWAPPTREQALSASRRAGSPVEAIEADEPAIRFVSTDEEPASASPEL